MDHGELQSHHRNPEAEGTQRESYREVSTLPGQLYRRTVTRDFLQGTNDEFKPEAAELFLSEGCTGFKSILCPNCLCTLYISRMYGWLVSGVVLSLEEILQRPEETPIDSKGCYANRDAKFRMDHICHSCTSISNLRISEGSDNPHVLAFCSSCKLTPVPSMTMSHM